MELSFRKKIAAGLLLFVGGSRKVALFIKIFLQKEKHGKLRHKSITVISISIKYMTDEYFMMQALKEARIAFDEDEIPIGAIVVLNGHVIARGHNMTEKLSDPTAHAEMIALTSAFNYTGSKYLPDAVLYVTIEPCLMCVGAMYWSKLKRVVWGADDEKNGYKRIANVNWPFHPKTEIIHGILKEECGQLMTDFFKKKR